MNKKKFYADIHQWSISKDGVRDFYWPVSHKYMSSFGEVAMHRFADILKEMPDNGPPLIYKFIINYFANDTCGFFQADHVKQNLDRDNIEFVVPKQWLIWPYILNEIRPPKSARLERLWRPKVGKKTILNRLLDPKGTLKILRLLTLKKGSLTVDGMEIKSSANNVVADAIYVTHRSELIKNHAEKSQHQIIFARSDRWYQPISQDEYQDSLSKSNLDIERKLLDAISSLYEEFGVKYSSASREFNTYSLKSMAALVRIHYTRLLKRRDIPKTLWTGTGSNIWDCMLSMAVRDLGGYVVGHDHGGGSAHVYMALVGFIELWCCNEFVSFNRQQAIELEHAKSRFPLLGTSTPKLSFIESKNKLHLQSIKKSIKGVKDIKNVVFLSTLYDQDRGRTLAFTSDAAYVDWQARAMSKFVEWGFNVYFKPHPESKSAPPKAFTEVIGVTILDGLFEDVMNKADLFVFDYTYTSVFMPALLSEVPMIVIDFEGITFHEGAQELLEKRASYIRGGLTHTHRIDVNFDELFSAIKSSIPKATNTEFVKKYFV